MAPRLRLSKWVVALTATVLLTTELGQLRAQTLNEGWNALDSKYRQARPHFQNYLKGNERFDNGNMDQVEFVDVVAKHHAYGVYLNSSEMMKPGQIDRDIGEFDGYIKTMLDAKNRETLQPLAEVFREKVRLRAWDVLQFEKGRPIHKLHNARLLAKAAALGQGQGQGALADTLIAALKDSKQNDGVHYYVLRGLGTLLAQVQPMVTPPVLTKEEQAKCAEAIVEFLEQRKGPSKNASRQEIDGFCLLRREAIRALSHVHTPAVNDKVRPALVLARFAGNDARIQPPPRIDERVEAALGLARMQSAQDKQYQPDYAAGQIVRCLGAFAQMATVERVNNTDKTTRPWRIDAAMLKEALAALKTDSGKNAFVAQVADRGTRLLDGVINNKKIDANELTWWSSSESDPPSKELFQGSADSVVKPAQPDEAPEK